MAIVTTYVCDVSGKQGNKEDFVDVKIRAVKLYNGHYNPVEISKLIHMDVAKNLHLVAMNKEEKEKIPEPTLESKLTTLLREYIEELAYEAGHEAAINAVNR